MILFELNFMIVRIVKVTLTPGKRLDFINLFRQVRTKISDSKGCMHVEVLTDSDNPDVAFTISHWATSNDLERYRQSELFASTWPNAKKLFAAPAEAWSLCQDESQND